MDSDLNGVCGKTAGGGERHTGGSWGSGLLTPVPASHRAGCQARVGYLPDVQAHGLVVPAWAARRAQLWSLQDGHVYLAGFADPQPELGVAGEAAVVPAASR